MENRPSPEKLFWAILNNKGAKIFEESKRILLEDIESQDLREPLEYASETYRDLLRPTLVVLSCEAVGGKPEIANAVATAMTLLGMSLYIFDDIVDRTEYRCFVPTTMGKFGPGKTLIAGGLITAKAFTHLNQADLPSSQRKRLSRLFWRFLRGMGEAETANLTLRKRRKIWPKDKFAVINMRTVNIEACTTAGAIIGSGTDEEIDHLGKFGRHLGLLLELVDDLIESLNFTVELREKIRLGSWPYILAWAEKHSKSVRNLLSSIIDKEADSAHTKKIVEGMFDSGAIDHVKDLSTSSVTGAKEELSNLGDTEARRMLTLIVESQSSFLPPEFVLDEDRIFGH